MYFKVRFVCLILQYSFVISFFPLLPVMTSLSTDINMTPVGDVPGPSEPSSSSALVKRGKRFEIKKWNAVALWAWGKKYQ